MCFPRLMYSPAYPPPTPPSQSFIIWTVMKAHLYKKASRQTRDRSRWSLSSSTSPPRDTNRRREHSSGSVSCDDGDDTSVFPAPPSIHQRTSTPPEDPGISMRVSPLDRPATTAVSSSQASLRGDGARTSEASKKVAVSQLFS